MNCEIGYLIAFVYYCCYFLVVSLLSLVILSNFVQIIFHVLTHEAFVMLLVFELSMSFTVLVTSLLILPVIP